MKQRRRVRSAKFVVIGLTGSIGTGKSTAAAMLKAMGCAVHDADRTVRALTHGGAAVRPIGRAFPGVVTRGRVDREKLRAAVAGKPAKLRRLEKILHPLVRKAELETRRVAARQKKPALVLDIPLLYETGGEKRCDAVIVTTATAAVQKKRVLARKGMNAARLKFMLARQLPDSEKRRRADFVVRSDRGRKAMRRSLRRALGRILERYT